jgi:hypothetical protein
VIAPANSGSTSVGATKESPAVSLASNQAIVWAWNLSAGSE